MNNVLFGFINTTTLRRAAAALVLALAGLPAVHAQTVLPPVTVTAPAIGGGTVLCTGDACANLLSSMQVDAYFELHDHAPPLGAEGDTPIDRNAFCSNLRGQKPSGCGSSAPPAPMVNTTLGLYALQHANGCGDGGWTAAIGDLIAGAIVEHYSGNPDAPMPGINFTGACNNHDACYAGQGERGGCDGAFYTELSSLCSAQSGQVRDICNGFSHAYSAAVSLGGQSAYDAAGQSYQCALWHDNMEDNACPQ